MYSFRIFRLVIIASLITYMIGCAWWAISKTLNNAKDVANKDTFVTRFGLNRLYRGSLDCEQLECYLDSDDVDERCKQEWIDANGCIIDYRAQMVIVSYFALTTLSTVGYGDYYPISTNEMIIAIFFMLGGIAFFSYIMNSF